MSRHRAELLLRVIERPSSPFHLSRISPERPQAIPASLSFEALSCLGRMQLASLGQRVEAVVNRVVNDVSAERRAAVAYVLHVSVGYRVTVETLPRLLVLRNLCDTALVATPKSVLVFQKLVDGEYQIVATFGEVDTELGIAWMRARRMGEDYHRAQVWRGDVLTSIPIDFLSGS